jgi:3-oxoacyl-[acyl-carrier protein] reductase
LNEKEMNVVNTEKGRVVLVTGASRGIGKGIVSGFAKRGASVAMVVRNADAARDFAMELSDAGSTVAVFAGDVTDRESMDQVSTKVVERFGGIDVVCANAGIFPSARLDAMTGDAWDEVLRVNARGTLFTVQAALPFLRKSAAGRIVITSSITGPVTGYAGWSHYAASKAAQLGFMRSAALELAHDRITINAVLPGNIHTEGLVDIGDDYLRKMEASIPLGHLGDVADVASAVMFLASPEARFITGQTLIVDGGQTLPENSDAC